MRNAVKLGLGVLLAASVLVTACGSSSGRLTSSSTRQPLPPSTSSVVEPTGQLIRLNVNATCSVSGDLEGKFTSSAQMPNYLVCILPDEEQWIDATFKQMTHPDYYFVPKGVTGGGTTGCPYDQNTLQYCTGSVVYLGEAAVWEQYSLYGDAAPAVVIAHELTHSFQDVAGAINGYEDARQIRYEDQADCGAGAFIAYAESQGWLNPTDDLVDLVGSLNDAGEAEGPDATHGTPDERLQAFDLGYLSTSSHPLYDCVHLVPEAPIIK